MHDHVAEHSSAWEEVYNSPAPHRAPLPDPFHELQGLQRVALVKCLRPDKVTLAIQVGLISVGELRGIKTIVWSQSEKKGMDV